MKKSFEQWIKEVDQIIGAKYFGLGHRDLPDVNYLDWYEDGISAKSAAAKAVKYAKEN